MPETFNPYQAPQTTDMHPVAAQWLNTPSVSLSRVASGLGMIYAGILLILLAAIVGAIFSGHIGVVQISAIAMAVGIVGRLLGIGGSLFCLATPPETGAREMIYASVGTMLAATAIDIASRLGIVGRELSLVGTLLSLVSWVVFLVYMRRLARFIGRLDLARRAKSIFIWCGIVALVAVAGVVIQLLPFLHVAADVQNLTPLEVTNGLVRGGGVGLILIGIAYLGALFVFIGYANLITYLRKAIRAGVSQNAASGVEQNT